MAGKSLQLAKAPKDWKPDRDDMQKIAADPRLQRLDRDSLYFFLKKPAGQSIPGAAKVGQPAPPPPPNQGLNFIQTIINALGGG